MPVFIGEAEAMAAFARRVWGIEPSKSKKAQSKRKKPKGKKPSYPKGMP